MPCRYTIKDLCLFGILRTFVPLFLFSMLPIDAYPKRMNAKLLNRFVGISRNIEKTNLFFPFGDGIKSSGLCFSFVRSEFEFLGKSILPVEIYCF